MDHNTLLKNCVLIEPTMIELTLISTTFQTTDHEIKNRLSSKVVFSAYQVFFNLFQLFKSSLVECKQLEHQEGESNKKGNKANC